MEMILDNDDIKPEDLVGVTFNGIQLDIGH